MNINERIKAAMKWLIGTGVAKNQAELGKLMGYTNEAALSKVVNGKVSLPGDFVDRLCKLDKSRTLNETWVSEGWGTMIDETRSFLSDSDRETIKEKLKNPGKSGVTYYDIDITASIKESFQDVVEVPEFYVDFRPFNDCTAYLPIWGDSMYPTYASGEIVAVKRLENPDIILWGEAYLIITNAEANNMKTIKLLFPHEEPDKLILRASNPNFKGDTVIPKRSVLNLYSIKGKITRKQL